MSRDSVGYESVELFREQFHGEGEQEEAEFEEEHSLELSISAAHAEENYTFVGSKMDEAPEVIVMEDYQEIMNKESEVALKLLTRCFSCHTRRHHFSELSSMPWERVGTWCWWLPVAPASWTVRSREPW